MASRAEIFSGGLRGLLSVGTWAHLMRWAKGHKGSVRVVVDYSKGVAVWTVELRADGQAVYVGSADTLENAMAQAVTGLGR